jgi:hypothetical protein
MYSVYLAISEMKSDWYFLAKIFFLIFKFGWTIFLKIYIYLAMK